MTTANHTVGDVARSDDDTSKRVVMTARQVWSTYFEVARFIECLESACCTPC
jgi:hypothetical protein